MALNLPQMPFKLTPQDMGNFDLGSAIGTGLKNYQEGINAKYRPELMEATINELKGRAQKNMMMSKLFDSLMGGGGLGASGLGTPSGIGDENTDANENGNNGVGSPENLRAAIIKGVTGIDPYLMSPQQRQNMTVQGQTAAQASKNNLSLGASNVVREYLQDKMEMPKEYLGDNASWNMAKDRVAAGFGDKEAEARLVKAAVINKLLPEYIGAQLGSQGIKTTVPALAHQEQAIKQGWAKASDIITQNLTPDMHAKADSLHNKYVQEINRMREEFNRSRGKRDKSNNNKQSKKYKWSDIEHTGRTRNIDPNQVVDKLAAKNNMSVEEFMKLVDMESK